MDFGTALGYLREGLRVTRSGWNGKDMWIRHIDLYSDQEFRVREQGVTEGTWLPFIVMKTADNKLVPWLASQSDVLAEDWISVAELEAKARQLEREEERIKEHLLHSVKPEPECCPPDSTDCVMMASACAMPPADYMRKQRIAEIGHTLTTTMHQLVNLLAEESRA